MIFYTSCAKKGLPSLESHKSTAWLIAFERISSANLVFCSIGQERENFPKLEDWMTSIKNPPRRKISIADVADQADRAAQIVGELRNRLLAPELTKQAPVFSLTQVAALCGTDKGQLSYRLAKGDLPPGTLNATR